MSKGNVAVHLTSRQAGPDMRTIAIPALPGAVDRANIVSSSSSSDSKVGMRNEALIKEESWIVED